MERPSVQRLDCPDCGSDSITSKEEEAIYRCPDCGYTQDISQTDYDQDISGRSDWEYWYPCPECGSTRLKQTQVAIVLATEDGKYGGEDDPNFSETIECAECGTVLMP